MKSGGVKAMGTDFKISVEGPGVTIERAIPEKLAHEILLLVLGGHGSRVAAAANAQMDERRVGMTDADRTSRVGGQECSLREFMNDHNPKRIPEKIAVITEFLEKYRETKFVNRQVLVDAFEEARESPPANLARDITWAVKIGWLAPGKGDPDSYYLTQSGVDAVEQKFPPEIRAKTKVSMGGRKKKNSGK